MKARTAAAAAALLSVLGWAAALIAAITASAAAAQENQNLPFIEPAETHHQAKPAALVAENPALTGRWETLDAVMPINPVHVALMHDGKVLVIAGSGNDPDNKNLQAGVWDPKTQTIKTFKIAWDMFCSAMVVLKDGRPLIAGGTVKYDPFFGQPRASAFNVSTETFAPLPPMGGGRWYPTATMLGTGAVMVDSGLNDTTGGINPSVQIWTGTAWTAAGAIFPGVPLYPRQHLLPSGKVFESGANRDSQLYDPAAHTFSTVATTNFASNRDYGTSVLLPLTPADGWKPRAMILGGASPTATDTTELIDLSVPTPKWAWVEGPKMVSPRVQLNATLLPNGRVLVSGGSKTDEDNASAVKEAQLYDPQANSFADAGAMEFPRLYHSNTLLLPDATVMALGGNPVRKVFQHEIEIYSPPYLFNADGTAAKRPTITAAGPGGGIGYGASFKVRTPDASTVKSVVLIRPGAVTHSFDMEQRLVGLSFTAGPGVLTAKAPANGNLAPPGYYLLFVLNAQGVPSVARFVRLSGASGARVARKP